MTKEDLTQASQVSWYLLKCAKKTKNKKQNKNQMKYSDLAEKNILSSRMIIESARRMISYQAPVVQRMENAMHPINLYAVYSKCLFVDTCLLNRDLSAG